MKVLFLISIFLYSNACIAQEKYYILFKEGKDEHLVENGLDKFIIGISDGGHKFTSQTTDLRRTKNLKKLDFTPLKVLKDAVHSNSDAEFFIVKRSTNGNYLIYPIKLE